jgi:RNA polymerase sigma factor (sigma-70 family)
LTLETNEKFCVESAWERFRSGDKEAFAFLYNSYVDILFHYGCKLSKDEDLVKDAIQEIFIDLYNGRERNNTSPENLKYYLILAVKRNLIKKLVRGRRFDIGRIKDKLIFEPLYNAESQLIELESQRELVERISDLLNQLTQKQKEAIYLRFNESLNYAEVAEIMGITIESVRKQVFRAIKQIKEILDSKDIVIFFYFLLKKS